ncbi:MAG TPA: hypothetical protein VLW85_21800 [Myxococcales bacterium]|nr:hypothetical protein [Myxococcales bacterium]
MRVVLVSCLVLVACQRNQIHAVLPPDVRIDVFPQANRAQLDALFVVDNSRYMGVHQARVAQSFHNFVDYLVQNQIDWHVGLVSSDVSAQPGVYLGGGSQQYFDSGSSASDVASAIVALGTAGSAISAVLQQADLSLRGPPDGFLRPGAALFIVLITDNNDPWSPGEDLYYYRAFKQSKGAGNDGIVRLSALAGPPPDGCSIPDPQNPQNTFVAQPAPRLQGIAQQMGGELQSLCDPQFDQVFDQLGATAAGLHRAFRLAKAPADPSALLVTVQAPCDSDRRAFSFCSQLADQCSDNPPQLVCTPQAGAWTYDAGTQSVIFAATALPPRGSFVEVQYKVPQ